MKKQLLFILLLTACACLTVGVQTVSAEEFKDGIFFGDHNWWWRVNNTTRHVQLESVSSTYNETVVEIPETVTYKYNGITYTVTSIAAGALNSNVEEVTIPVTVTELEPKLFSLYKKLRRVNLPSTLKTIGSQAFWGSSISEIDLPEGLETIGAQAFSSCDELIEITVPASVTSIENDCFSFCKNLREATIKSKIKTLPKGTFSFCEELRRVNLPSTLKAIGSEAFWGSGITEIDLPEGLETIGDEAFDGCDELIEITVPASVTSIGNKCFSFCENLREATIKSNIKTLPKGTFSFCEQLLNVALPYGMEEIGESAFSQCYSLSFLTCPKSIWKLGNSAFQNCYSITNLDWGPNITEIGDNCFWGCTVQSVTLPGVRTIGNNAFYNCSFLSYVWMPAVEHIGMDAFYNCYSLRDVSFPNTLREIESGAFWNCKRLTRIDLAQVGILGISIFSYCDNLEEVTIRRSAEYDHSIVDPFSGCKNIKKLHIASSCTSIKDFDFTDCNQLMVVTCDALTPPDADYYEYSYYISRYTFSQNTFDKAVLVVPEEAESAYRSHPFWKIFFRDEQPVLETAGMRVNGGYPSYVVRYIDNHNELYTPAVFNIGSIWNNSAESVTSAFGNGLYDMNLNLVQVACFCEQQTFSPWEEKTCYDMKSIGDGIPDGDYFLAPFYGDPKNKTDHLSNKWWEEKNHVNVYIYEDTIAFYERLYDQFEITRGKMVFSPARVNHLQMYGINYAQRGNRPFKHKLYFMVDGNCEDSVKVNLPKHGSWFTRFHFTPKEPGEKTITITIDYKDAKPIWTDHVKIEPYPDPSEEEPDECSLTLLYPETGSITLPAEMDEQMNLTITAEEGWSISSVYFDDTDLTAQMDSEGHVTTPPITMNSTIAVAYEQVVTDAIRSVSRQPDTRLQLNGTTATVTNARPGTVIRVFTISGQTVKTATAGNDGTATFTLTRGRLYIINCGTKAFKIRL